MPLPHYFVIIKLVVTTATLPVTCHIRLREATFSHENMAVSVRIKYHKTWGTLRSINFIPWRRTRFVGTLKTIFYFR